MCKCNKPRFPWIVVVAYVLISLSKTSTSITRPRPGGGGGGGGGGAGGGPGGGGGGGGGGGPESPAGGCKRLRARRVGAARAPAREVWRRADAAARAHPAVVGDRLSRACLLQQRPRPQPGRRRGRVERRLAGGGIRGRPRGVHGVASAAV
jgi:hypothetical protein